MIFLHPLLPCVVSYYCIELKPMFSVVFLKKCEDQGTKRHIFLQLRNASKFLILCEGIHMTFQSLRSHLTENTKNLKIL